MRVHGAADGFLLLDMIDTQGYEAVCRWEMATGRLSVWPVLLGFSTWPGTLRTCRCSGGELLVGSLFDGKRCSAPASGRKTSKSWTSGCPAVSKRPGKGCACMT